MDSFMFLISTLNFIVDSFTDKLLLIILPIVNNLVIVSDDWIDSDMCLMS